MDDGEAVDALLPAGVVDGRTGSRTSDGLLLADRKLLDVLAADGFQGPRYDRFEDALAAYAIAVLCGWMHSGQVFRLTASRGFPLNPTGDELAELSRNADLRDELANMTVALTLPPFRSQALIGGGWRIDRGAGISTYFMGATLLVFPNEFRQFRAYRRRYAEAARSESVLRAPACDPYSDPAVIVPDGLRVRDELRQLDERTAETVTLSMLGYGHEEIAELLGLPSPRAVEGILYRWRAKAKPRIGERGELDGRF